MSRKLIQTLLSLVMGVILGGVGYSLLFSQSTSTIRTSPMDEIEHVIRSVEVAIPAGDVNTLAELFYPDASIFEHGQLHTSWLDYEVNHLTPELLNLRDLEYGYSNLLIRTHATAAWATFDYSGEATDTRNNQRLTSSGVGSMILIFMGERWKIVHLHLTGD